MGTFGDYLEKIDYMQNIVDTSPTDVTFYDGFVTASRWYKRWANTTKGYASFIINNGWILNINIAHLVRSLTLPFKSREQRITWTAAPEFGHVSCA
ncbi:hypothetical protein M405DRAFT_811549 [Rhizopogon salebrosus TDB-379]|nr:hypothetical protein M405DRAFT_811549 [Rhizopogon salebrosus TDB-379]